MPCSFKDQDQDGDKFGGEPYRNKHNEHPKKDEKDDEH